MKKLFLCLATSLILNLPISSMESKKPIQDKKEQFKIVTESAYSLKLITSLYIVQNQPKIVKSKSTLPIEIKEQLLLVREANNSVYNIEFKNLLFALIDGFDLSKELTSEYAETLLEKFTDNSHRYLILCLFDNYDSLLKKTMSRQLMRLYWFAKGNKEQILFAIDQGISEINSTKTNQLCCIFNFLQNFGHLSLILEILDEKYSSLKQSVLQGLLLFAIHLNPKINLIQKLIALDLDINYQNEELDQITPFNDVRNQRFG